MLRPHRSDWPNGRIEILSLSPLSMYILVSQLRQQHLYTKQQQADGMPMLCSNVNAVACGHF